MPAAPGNGQTANGATRQGVTCRAVLKDYGSGGALVHALQGVDLEVAPGELTLLVGPSGCGKTTLISIIAGTLDPTGGDVSVLGKNLKELSKREKTAFRAQNVGFVFQQFNLLPSLTAAENVSVPLVINRVATPDALARATETLKAVGLADKTNALPSQLSGGQQQRVAIARAIVSDPTLLVCDEPTGDLDRETAEEILGLLQHLNRDGKTVVMVTHDPKAASFASRIVHLDKGALASEAAETAA
jgi:putative ABC transport system ATP-binding protein